MKTKHLKVRRSELKFYLSRTEYECVKRVVAAMMTRDKNQKSEDGYFIRSLYFDDLSNRAITEKLAGVDRRDKYRLRIYEFDQDWVKLERKSKFDDYVSKDTGLISRRDAQALVDGDRSVLLDYDNPALTSIYADMARAHFRPVCVVDYIRDAYLLDFNNVRLTFDKHLRRNQQNFDLFDGDMVTQPIMRDEIVVLEIKYNHFLPEWIKTMLNLEVFQRSAISKYVMSRLPGDGWLFV